MTNQNDDKRHEMLDAEFHRLAQQPVGRGPEADELWARAEIARRLESQPVIGSGSELSLSAVWSPLVGACVALLAALGLWVAFGSHSPSAEAGGALAATLGIVLGSLGVLALAACSSLALLWHDL